MVTDPQAIQWANGFATGLGIAFACALLNWALCSGLELLDARFDRSRRARDAQLRALWQQELRNARESGHKGLAAVRNAHYRMLCNRLAAHEFGK